MTDVDRTPKPCLHKQADHQHGHRATYVLDRCRCLPCCHAASVYELERTKRNAYGRSNLVDAQPVREHMAGLMAAGIGLKRVVEVSGVAQGVLWKLIYGKNGGTPSRRVTRATAHRLLTLDPADPTLLADGAKVISAGTTRRLQALTCLGWSTGRLAVEAGLDRQRLDAAINGRAVVMSTVRAVNALYERLWNQPPPAKDQRERISVSRSIRRAADAGWAPPLAWDEESIDDPQAAPLDVGQAGDDVDELAVDLVLDGQPMTLTGRELEAAALALSDRGLGYGLIAARCRTDEETVRRVLNTARTRTKRAAA